MSTDDGPSYKELLFAYRISAMAAEKRDPTSNVTYHCMEHNRVRVVTDFGQTDVMGIEGIGNPGDAGQGYADQGYRQTLRHRA